MDLGSLLLGLALLLIVAAFVARPLIERTTTPSDAASPADPLLAERENVLAALRDLDFDHATGKIEDIDYQGQRARLVRHGADVLRQLDALGISDGQSSLSLEDEIEAAIAAHRDTADDEIEAAIAAQRGATDGHHRPPARPAPAPAKPAAAPRFCAQCGTRAEPGDRFCARCGAHLPAPVETP